MSAVIYEMPIYVHPNCLIDAMGLIGREWTEEKLPGIATTLERYWTPRVWAEAIRMAVALTDKGYSRRDITPIRPHLLPAMKYYRHAETDTKFAVLLSEIEFGETPLLLGAEEIRASDFEPYALIKAQHDAVDAEIAKSGL